MRKLLLIAAGAILVEILSMQVKVMNLPTRAGRDFGILVAILVLVAVWEKAKPDERDQTMTWYSSHIAFLFVATSLVGILLYQTISGAVQLSTLYAIGALLLGKVIGRLMAARHS